MMGEWVIGVRWGWLLLLQAVSKAVVWEFVLHAGWRRVLEVETVSYEGSRQGRAVCGDVVAKAAWQRQSHWIE